MGLKDKKLSGNLPFLTCVRLQLLEFFFFFCHICIWHKQTETWTRKEQDIIPTYIALKHNYPVA